MLRIIHVELDQANNFVRQVHRHHKAVTGHRYSLGLWDKAAKRLVGVAIVGRPVARKTRWRGVLEVTRLATDGTKNACSMLYAAAARAGKELGYRKIQTFILHEEPGTSLEAAGWVLVDEACGGGDWTRSDGEPRRQDQPQGVKKRYEKVLNRG